MKKVVVKGYTYETDLSVKVGDVVELPSAYWLRDILGDTWEGVVDSLESDYVGSCAKIIRIVKQAERSK